MFERCEPIGGGDPTVFMDDEPIEFMDGDPIEFVLKSGILTGLDDKVETLSLLDREEDGEEGMSCESTSMGNVNANREPTPSSDSTQRSPPIRLTSILEMARPRPVPPYFRAVEISI